MTLARFRPMRDRMVMPDVCCDILWVRGRLLMSGPLSRAVPSRNVGEDVTLLRLSPLTARAHLRAPLKHFTDATVELASVAPHLARNLERSRDAGQLETLVGSADDLTGAGIDPRSAPAMSALKRGASVEQAAAQVALSARQLERIFVEELGLAPKTFARIVRFRRAFGAAKRGARLAEAAAEAGYADQAHFSREVRKLTGSSPGILLPHVGNVQDVVAGRE